MSNKLPKVLIPCINAWRDESGIRTLIDIFSHWDKDCIAQIYTRADLPKTKICKNFFQISENEVLHSIIKRNKYIGRRVYNEADILDKYDKSAMLEEHERYAKARKKHSWLMSICREIVWALGKWKSKELDRFIDEFDPDVLFLPIYPTVYMGWIQLYIMKKTNKPVICYLADDNYTYKTCSKNPLAYLHRFFLRKVVKKIMKKCNKLFVIVPKQKAEYDKIFNTNSVILTKGIDFNHNKFIQNEVNSPISMVYTGKMVIGRDKSLVKISKALEKINKKEIKIKFDIYSPDISTPNVMEMLNKNGCTFKGSINKSEVEEIQKNADIVVFVESLEKKYRYAARLSFSTKLTDYFKSGKCIFAIGDKDIAPIDYLKSEDAAIIATNYAEIEQKLNELSNSRKIILEYGAKGYECGRRNHDEEKIKQILLSNILEVVSKK